MKLITAKGTLYDIPTVTSFKYKGKTKIDRGFWRWLVILLLFYLALLCWFFVGTEVWLVEINGVEYAVDETQYKVLVNKMMEE